MCVGSMQTDFVASRKVQNLNNSKFTSNNHEPLLLSAECVACMSSGDCGSGRFLLTPGHQQASGFQELTGDENITTLLQTEIPTI